MKTTKPTVGYSRHQTIIDIHHENAQFYSSFINPLYNPSQAVGDRVWWKVWKVDLNK